MFVFGVNVVVQSLSHVRLFVTPWTAADGLVCAMDAPGYNVYFTCIIRLLTHATPLIKEEDIKTKSS